MYSHSVDKLSHVNLTSFPSVAAILILFLSLGSLLIISKFDDFFMYIYKPRLFVRLSNCTVEEVEGERERSSPLLSLSLLLDLALTPPTPQCLTGKPSLLHEFFFGVISVSVISTLSSFFFSFFIFVGRSQRFPLSFLLHWCFFCCNIVVYQS